MNISDYTYICIEGVVGVGKTSLARLLSAKINARFVLEKIEENPFLNEFYENPREKAFIAQINFLLLRYEQQKIIRQPDLFHKVTISDYFFEKDRIFASVNLNEQELRLYERISKMLIHEVPAPDLIIFLQASVRRLMENIKRRNRPFEEYITQDYLQNLTEAYNEYIFRYAHSPILVVNTTNTDFIQNPSELENLIAQLGKPLRGIHYYNPKG